MKWIIYAVIIGLSLIAPVERLDVENLLPIEAVALYYEDGQLTLETDTGHKGSGDSVANALKDLKKRTPAVVYLDTARYLMVAPEAERQVNAMKGYLGARTEVSLWDVRGQVKMAMEYLQVHGKTVRLESFS